MADPALSVADVLERAADKVARGSRLWKQGDGADSHSICAGLAIIAEAGDRVAYKPIFMFAKYLGGSGMADVYDWNDAPERTQAEVVAKLREAAKLARERGE